MIDVGKGHVIVSFLCLFLSVILVSLKCNPKLEVVVTTIYMHERVRNRFFFGHTLLHTI